MGSPPNALVLGSRLDGVRDDFDGGGPRTLVLKERSSIRPGAWVANVKPPIASPDGRKHDTVLVFPLDERGQVWPEIEGSYCAVAVGPTPETPPAWFVGYSWFTGETARTKEDLPQSRRERLEEEWDYYQRWLADGGEVNPQVSVVFDGFPLGRRLAHIKADHQHGLLDPEIHDRFDSVPGFAWWRDDVIGWLREWANREGHCEVPLDYEEEGRPWGRQVDSIVKSYLRAVAMARLSGPSSVFMSDETIGELEDLPGWMGRVDGRKADE